MAKSSSVTKMLSSLITSFTGSYDSTALSPFIKDAYKPRSALYSDAERDTMLRLANQSTSQPQDAAASPQSYFGALSRKNIQDTLDNERLIQMCPEISLAASVMVPSILAPNDMREGEIQFECTAEFLTESQRNEISKMITEFGESYFSFSTQLPKWIEEAMYRSGAKAFMVLPLSELYRKMTDPANIMQSMSTENFNAITKNGIENNRFGFGDDETNTSTESLTMGVEGLDNELSKFFQGLVPGKTIKSTPAAVGKLKSLMTAICSTENLAITDNPDRMTLKDAKNRMAKKSLSEKIQLAYKVAEYDSVASGEDPLKDLTGHPLFVTWPTEAVIPIYTPGTPSDHIGYYVIEDEYGHPIDAMTDQNGGLFNPNPVGSANSASNQNTIAQLFQAYGFTQNQMYDQIPERQVMENIYQQIVENHLKSRAQKAGFADVSLGSNAALYRNMFNRFIQQRQTRLLFVPKEFMTYFCFKHSKYGTGVSKLDDLKWILSLRISLLTTRMLSAFKNAIDRRLIDINFDNKYPGNALQHMRSAQREAIDKELVTFSTLPEDTARLLAERSFAVKVTGVPGIPQYSITKDTDTRGQTTPPDTSLSDDIKNMEYLGLEVPPAVMNNLNDAEFSRSVATTNIVFSRKLAVYQRIVCRYFSELMRNFIRFSEPLMKKLTAIVSGKAVDAKASDEKGVVDTNKKDTYHNRIHDIVDSIDMVLPPPTMAPNSAQFDAMQKMTDSITALTTAAYPDDYAAGDAKLQSAISAFRAYHTSSIIREYARRQGVSDINMPSLTDVEISDEFLKARHALTNMAAGIQTQTAAVIKPLSDENGGDGMGGDTGAGGGFGDTGSDDTGVDNFDSTSPTSDTTDATDPASTASDFTEDDNTAPPSTTDTSSDTTPTTPPEGTGESPDEGPTGKSLI